MEKIMNYYEILKVSKNASDSEIKSSYKQLVKKYHPDLYVGDKEFAEKKIKEINEAYDILSNSEKKLEYDEYLASLTQTTQSYNVHYTSQNSQTNYSQNER
jgi:curved DNA-binding protein CbpA